MDTEIIESIKKERINHVFVYAFRYALGKSSQAPNVVVNALKENWWAITKHARETIQKEIKEADNMAELGHPINRQAWLSLLSLPVSRGLVKIETKKNNRLRWFRI